MIEIEKEVSSRVVQVFSNVMKIKFQEYEESGQNNFDADCKKSPAAVILTERVHITQDDPRNPLSLTMHRRHVGLA